MKADLTDATVTLLLTIDNEVHLVAMTKEKYDAVSFLAKASTETAIKTNVDMGDLRKFLGVDK